jgi:hypothetical protein
LYTNDYRALKYAWPKEWKFWIARYADYTGKFYPDFKPKFKNWKLHQWTSRGKVEGIEGNVDLNFSPLSKEELVGNSRPPSTPPSGIQKYSQNNPKWKDDFMGDSNLTLGKYGCLTSAICTLASYFGETLTPKDLASHKELYTKDGLIIWNQLNHILKKLDFLLRIRSFSEKAIDDALVYDPNKCVLLNCDFGYHWVGALKKTYLGYTASDPYPYPAVNRNYKNNAVEGFAILIKK